MSKASKATKKFQKKHLKATVEKRHVGKKVQDKAKKHRAKVVDRYLKEEVEVQVQQKIEKKANKAATDESPGWGTMKLDDILEAEDNTSASDEDDGKEIDDEDLEDIDDDFDLMEFSDNEDTPGGNHIHTIKNNANNTTVDSDTDENSDAEESLPQPDAIKHKKQLNELKKSQPEFYQYLVDNDQELLDFDVSEDEEEDRRDESSDDDDEGIHEAKKQGTELAELTKDMLQKWDASLKETHSIKTLKSLLVAFRSAIVSGNDVEAQKFPQLIVYQLANVSVFKKLVVTALKHTTPAFDKYLSYDHAGKQLPSSSPRWKSIALMIKSYLSNCIKLYRQLSEESMISFFLHELNNAMPYFTAFPQQAKQLFKLLLNTWGTASDILRVRAFANIRQLAIILPKTFLEPCLKGVYMTLVKSCRNTTTHTLPLIRFMSNCAVDVYGLDATRSYQYAFVYIRQLAIHLRNAITIRTEETYKQVYNWQFIHSLRFWCNIFVTYCHKDQDGASNPLSSLIYPFVQVTLGVLRLVSTSQYHPLHMHLLNSLADLAAATGTFIPLTSYFVDILHHSPVFTRKPKPATLKPFDISVYLKCPKQYMHTRAYAQLIQQHLQLVMLKYYASLSTSIAFPELIIPVVVALKSFTKMYKATLTGKRDATWTKAVAIMVEKMEENRRWIIQRRSTNADFAPSATDRVASFLVDFNIDDTPLGKYTSGVHRVETKQLELLKKSLAEEDEDDTPSRNKGANDDNASDSDEFGIAEQEEEDDLDTDDDENTDAAPTPFKSKSKSELKSKKQSTNNVNDDSSDEDYGFFSELTNLDTVREDEASSDDE